MASFLGLSLYLMPKIALVLLLTWIITFVVFRYSSLAAIAAAVAAIIALIITMPIGNNLFLMLTLVLLVLIKHKENIIRLLNGKESKFGRNK